MGLIFDYSLKFDSTLRKASNLVRYMNNYEVLTQRNLSISQKLAIWKTYFCSKLVYPLVILCLMNKSASQKVASQFSMSIKKCLGLHQSLPKEILFTWLYELMPNERAEIFVLRLVRKLQNKDHKTKNQDFFLSKISNCSKEEINKYLCGELKLHDIKESLLNKRAKAAGIRNGKPFETLCSNDLDWLHFTTKELDIYRWKGKTCNLCRGNLSTEHLITCVDLERDRKLIGSKTGVEASIVLEDPSILNKRPKLDAKNLKSFVAGRISKMIHSAERRVIG